MDAALRELERRWRESGAVDDQAAWLAAAIRAGAVDAELVRLAAEVGHPAARHAVDTELAPHLGAWLDRACARASARGTGNAIDEQHQLLVLAAVAAARALEPACYRHLGGDSGAEGPRVARALRALRAVVRARSPAELNVAVDAASRAAEQMRVAMAALEVDDQDVEAFAGLLSATGGDIDALQGAARDALLRRKPALVRPLLLEELGEWLVRPRGG